MDALARAIDRRCRLVLAATVAFVAFAAAFGGPVVGMLDSDDDFEDPGQESVLAREAVERATGRSATPDLVALVRSGAPAGSAQRQRVRDALRDPAVAAVGGQAATESASFYYAASFRDGVDRDEVAARLQARLERVPGVIVGGGVVAYGQVGEQVQEDLARAETLAFPILFLLSLVVFRGVVAALLPLAVGAVTILTTFALLRLVNAVEPMSVFAINLITGLGLGLAIDYSLFMVSRYREELERGDAPLRATMRTAGRTVLFSAVTVAAALAALIVFPLRFLFSMGVGGVLVALTAAVVSLTVLPALLAVLGPRVNALGLRRHRAAAPVRSGPWYRFSQAVMRWPGPIAAATAVLLIVIGLPFLRIEFTGVDAGVLPPERSARVVDDALRTEFPQAGTSAVYVAAGAPADERGAVAGYASALAGLPGVAEVREPRAADGLWRIDVVASESPLTESTKQLVRDIRARDAPFPVRVGGQTAQFLDQQSSLGDSLPLALALLAGSTLVILFVMTGSVVLPVKALVMNLLTLSAAFGLLVLIFQDGRLEGLLAFEQSRPPALESTQPILLALVPSLMALLGRWNWWAPRPLARLHERLAGAVA